MNTFTKCPGNRVRFKVSQNRAAAGGLGHEGQARQPTQSLAVEGVVGTPCIDPLVEDAELPPPHARQEVAQAVVVADVGVLVVRRRVARLGRQEARLLDPLFAVGDQRPAPAQVGSPSAPSGGPCGALVGKPQPLTQAVGRGGEADRLGRRAAAAELRPRDRHRHAHDLPVL